LNTRDFVRSVTLWIVVLGEHAFARLCQARRALIEVRDEPLAIKQIARDSNLSLFHFIRQFEALFGVTPHQFRIQSRLDRAMVLLAQDELSITEVCMEVGMSSLGSFSDLFARRVGERPSTYQRRARVMVQMPGILPHALFPGCFSMMAHLPETAFRNFEEATPEPVPIKSAHANQTD